MPRAAIFRKLQVNTSCWGQCRLTVSMLATHAWFDAAGNVRLQVSSPEMRPAVIFDHVEDVAVNGLSVQANSCSRVGAAVYRLKADSAQQHRVCYRRLRSFFSSKGARNIIKIDGGDLSRA